MRLICTHTPQQTIVAILQLQPLIAFFHISTRPFPHAHRCNLNTHRHTHTHITARIVVETLTFRNQARAKKHKSKHSPWQHNKCFNIWKMLTCAKGAAGVHCVSHSDYSHLLVTKTAVCVTLGGKKRESWVAFTKTLHNPTGKGTAAAELWHYIRTTLFSGKPGEIKQGMTTIVITNKQIYFLCRVL